MNYICRFYNKAGVYYLKAADKDNLYSYGTIVDDILKPASTVLYKLCTSRWNEDRLAVTMVGYSVGVEVSKLIEVENESDLINAYYLESIK